MKAPLSDRVKRILQDKQLAKSLMQAIFAEKRGDKSTIDINSQKLELVRLFHRNK